LAGAARGEIKNAAVERCSFRGGEVFLRLYLLSLLMLACHFERQREILLV